MSPDHITYGKENAHLLAYLKDMSTMFETDRRTHEQAKTTLLASGHTTRGGAMKLYSYGVCE